MSNIFWKHFQLCFSKFICLPTAVAANIKPPFGDDDEPPSFTTATTFIKSFNTLYDSSLSTSKSLTTTDLFSSSSAASSTTDDSDLSPPDFATVLASQRLFFSSPGRSNSIIDSPGTKTTEEAPPPPPPPQPLNGGVAVRKYSPDPYVDFRESMQEMIEARELTDVRSNGEFLHELLFCYLSLNPKHAHKFIISAFADLIITLCSPPDDDYS
ncbi:hypothetical protein ACFE04_005946 [Oxalis oulophora]